MRKGEATLDNHNNRRSGAEPYFLLALFLLLGVALNRGVFPELAQQIAVIVALCCLHVALIGRVHDFSRSLRIFANSLRGKTNPSPEDDMLWYEIAASSGVLTQESEPVGRETRKIKKSQPVAAWSSGHWMG